MSDSEDFGAHPRVRLLLERFRGIDAAMRDLPVYNDRIAIEAIGFRAFGDDALIGIVLTPWFMNLVLLPITPEPMRMGEIGKSVLGELPAGKRSFVIGGDEVVGLYRAHSLHSPVVGFTLPGQARAEARRLLSLLMTPPVPEKAPGKDSGAPRLDRRALLFGRRQPMPTADDRA